MATKPCTICTRVMALEQFRQYKTGLRAGQRQHLHSTAAVAAVSGDAGVEGAGWGGAA